MGALHSRNGEGSPEEVGIPVTAPSDVEIHSLPPLDAGNRILTTTIHRLLRKHLGTYLTLANETDPTGEGMPDHVGKEIRSALAAGRHLTDRRNPKWSMGPAAGRNDSHRLQL